MVRGEEARQGKAWRGLGVAPHHWGREVGGGVQGCGWGRRWRVKRRYWLSVVTGSVGAMLHVYWNRVKIRIVNAIV